MAAFWGINTCLYYITAQWGIFLLLGNTGVPRFSTLPGLVRYLVWYAPHLHWSGLGWGSGSRNTENTGKYRSSIVLNTENVQYRNFNTIEYRNIEVQ